MDEVPAVPFEPQPRTQTGGSGNGTGTASPKQTGYGSGEPPRSGIGAAGNPDPKTSVGARLLAVVNWVLTHLTSPSVTPAIIALAAYVWCTWGAVRVLPFDGDEGPALALQLSRALDGVDAGAHAGLDDDVPGVNATTSQPPNLTIPGTNVSITSLLGFLGETQVQGVVVRDDSPAPQATREPHKTRTPRAAAVDEKKSETSEKRTYRVRLQIHRLFQSARVETDPKATRDEAVTAAAEQLYAEIEPVTAAYYYFYRDSDRSLALIQRALANPDEPRRYDAHHAWGLVLRDLPDVDGALGEFRRALASTSEPMHRASIYLDMGYVAAEAKRWDEAVTYFDHASQAHAEAAPSGWKVWLQPRPWIVPSIRKADVLRESGRLDLAFAEYAKDLRDAGPSMEVWSGLGRVYVAKGKLAKAITVFDRARRLAPSKAAVASLVRVAGDALVVAGCPTEGVQRYADAVAIDASYDLELTQKSWGRMCPYSPTARSSDARCMSYLSHRRA
jgi:tetratricopeptide (TPR) repeat protein